MANIKSGQLKAIGITGDARVPALPQVPTFIEGGLPGVVLKSWWGIFAPAGTPKEIIDKLSAELAKIMAMPDIKEKLAAQGAAPFSTNSAQFAEFIIKEIAKYARIIKGANIKLEK